MKMRRNFIRFSLGFIGLVLLGLLALVFTGLYDDSNAEPARSGEIPSEPQGYEQ